MRKRILFLLLTGITQTVFSQTDTLSTPVYASRTATDAGDPLFNGREHINYLSSIEGFAYYQSPEWQTGTLVFQDIAYRNLLLKYDLVADELIVRHINGFTGVALFTPRIQSFVIGNRRFVYLSFVAGSSLQPGIYQELSKGKLSLYAKHSKSIKETVSLGGIERQFIDRNNYYVFLGGNYYPVRKEKDMMDLIQEKRNEIKAFLKESGIKYKADPEAALKKIVDYYNQLSR